MPPPGWATTCASAAAQAAEQIEHHEAHVAHRVLDVVAEHPEEPHVADQVEPAAVHEHRGDQGEPARLPDDALDRARAKRPRPAPRCRAARPEWRRAADRARERGLGAGPWRSTHATAFSAIRIGTTTGGRRWGSRRESGNIDLLYLGRRAECFVHGLQLKPGLVHHGGDDAEEASCDSTRGFASRWQRARPSRRNGIAPGDAEGGPRNRHRGADQWLFVVAGTGRARVNGKRYVLRTGSLLLLERGDEHEITATGRAAAADAERYVPPGIHRGRRRVAGRQTLVSAGGCWRGSMSAGRACFPAALPRGALGRLGLFAFRLDCGARREILTVQRFDLCPSGFPKRDSRLERSSLRTLRRSACVHETRRAQRRGG